MVSTDNTRAQATSENIPPQVDPSQAVRAFARVHGWVRDGVDTGPTGVRTTGASVTLRWRGRTVGEGLSMLGDDPVGDAGLQAVSSAQRWAEEKGVEHVWRERVTIEVELTGAWSPRIGRDWAALGTFAKPGVRALAAEITTDTGVRRAVLMPGKQLRYGLNPIGAWRRVGTSLGLGLGRLSDLVGETGVRFYTSQTLRIAQTRPGEVPVIVHRVGDVVDLNDVSTARLRGASDDMARFLLALRWPGDRPLGLRGDFALYSTRYTPEIAPLREQLVACFALARYARTSGVDPEVAASARRGASEVLRDALLVEPGETLFADDPVACAVFLLALSELSRSGAIEASSLEAVGPARRLLVSFITGPGAERIEAGVAAVIGLALIRDARDLGGPADHLERGGAIARALMIELGPAGAHVAMPWLGWGLLEASGSQGAIAGGDAMLVFRTNAERLQARVELLETDNHDLRGGFLWGEDATGYPDWRSARIAAAFGRMLGDPRLTDEQVRLEHLDRLRRSARFVMQLMVRESWSTPGGLDGIGGVRRVAWGDHAAVDATSMSLLALCETIDGVERAFGR